ncbi:unnamed protein product [Urochloa humidicola]
MRQTMVTAAPSPSSRGLEQGTREVGVVAALGAAATWGRARQIEAAARWAHSTRHQARHGRSLRRRSEQLRRRRSARRSPASSCLPATATACRSCSPARPTATPAATAPLQSQRKTTESPRPCVDWSPARRRSTMGKTKRPPPALIRAVGLPASDRDGLAAPSLSQLLRHGCLRRARGTRCRAPAAPSPGALAPFSLARSPAARLLCARRWPSVPAGGIDQGGWI